MLRPFIIFLSRDANAIFWMLRPFMYFENQLSRDSNVMFRMPRSFENILSRDANVLFRMLLPIEHFCHVLIIYCSECYVSLGVNCHCMTLFILLLYTLERKQLQNLKILFSYTFAVTKPTRVEIFSVFECWHFTHIWTAHAWPHHFAQRGGSVHIATSTPPVLIKVPFPS